MTQVRHSPDASRLPLPSTIAARDGAFHSTQWSLVLAAGFDSPAAQHALEKLCQRYWPPLYAFIRRQGYTPHDAQDLTQAFFERLLEKNYLDQVDRAKGKFRSFLLAAVKHFLAEFPPPGELPRHGPSQKPRTTFVETRISVLHVPVGRPAIVAQLERSPPTKRRPPRQERSSSPRREEGPDAGPPLVTYTDGAAVRSG